MNDKFRLAFIVDTKRIEGCFYTVTMIIGLRVVVVYLLCLHSTDCQDAPQSVTGPPFLITTGDKNLTLTCPAGSAGYEWFTPAPDTHRCQTGPTENVCTFQPTLEDDNKDVICNLLDSNDDTVGQSTYTVNLKYPPQSSPNIPVPSTIEHGDVITCTVSGGKPRVANVTFRCDPGHPDQEDEVSDDGRNVSSSITVNILQRKPDKVNCTCSAFWAPDPGLYTRKFNQSFDVETNKQSRLIASGVGVTGFAAVVIMCVI